MKQETITLFALLRCAVFGEALSEKAKVECEEKADLFYKMAKKHDLAHLVKYAFDVSAICARDATSDFDLIRAQATAVLRYEDSAHALGELREVLEKNKIPFVPLKGSVIRELYPEPWMRTSCDIDILVREEDFEVAAEIIRQELSYKDSGEYAYHDISLFSPTGIHLELHFSIKEKLESIDRLLEKVWEHASPKSNDGYEYALSKEFILFQHIAHMFYHMTCGGCGIRSFIDLVLLENKLEYNAEVFEKMLQVCELELFYENARHLSKVWFSDKEHNETSLLLQKYLLEGGVYGKRKNAIAAKDEKKGAAEYIFGRIIMPYELLCIKYPRLKDKPYLAPFYQVKRWLGVFHKRKIGKISAGISANNSVTDKEKAEYSLLFERLGIKN